MIPKFRAFLIEVKTMRDVVGIDFVRNMYCLQVGRATIGEWFWYRDLELMQSTGLQDKNGKTYYEGDLVKWDDEIFQVKFDRYQFVLEGFYEPCQDVPYDFFSEGAYKDAEIIGNIYENPNLLEGQS